MQLPIEAQAATPAESPKKEENKKPIGPGRPTVMTTDVLLKIEQVAALDGSVEEMALYAGINRSTLYKWLQEDEELRERIEELREKPVLKARQTVVSSLDNPDYAFKYLERKRAKEFMPQAKLNHGGGVTLTPGEITPEVEEVKAKYENEMRMILSKPDPNKLMPRIEEPVQAQDGQAKAAESNEPV